MEYQRVGRGGAGNYYSKKDLDEVSKRAAEQKDVEAQKPLTTHHSNTSDSSQAKYVNSGRGGAGNVKEGGTLPPTTDEDPTDVSASAQAKTASNPGHYGRGGAGNYAGTEPTPKQTQETELREIKNQDVYAKAEAGLQEPEKAHLGGQ